MVLLFSGPSWPFNFQTVSQKMACDDFEDYWFAEISQPLTENIELKSMAEVAQDVDQQPWSSDLKNKIKSLYQLMSTDLKSTLNITTPGEHLEALMGLGVGDSTTPQKALLKIQTQKIFSEIKFLTQNLHFECFLTPEEKAEKKSLSRLQKTSLSGGVVARAAHQVLGLAYQSCLSTRLPAMTGSSPSVEGVSVVGQHPDGVGRKRVISDLAAFQQSHYYLKQGSDRGEDCFSAFQHPLIYDYGGKPSANSNLNSQLNLFKEAGTGTPVLGIDCSGYVFSALAWQGLRLAPGKRLVASQVYGVRAQMFMNPSENGLSCFKPVGFSPQSGLANGDVLASHGHVVVIDRVGDDPFGVSWVKSSADCARENISYKNFDFEILQSSPVKGGIGINRIKAASYLSESDSMREGLEQYAMATCLSHFGKSSTPKPDQARLVRHTLSSDCVDRPIEFTHSQCIKSCPASN